MNTYFASILSSNGCSSHLDGVLTAQYSSAGYIRSSTAPADTSRKRLEQRVANGETTGYELRAAIEVHIRHYPHCDIVRRTRRLGLTAHVNELLAFLMNDHSQQSSKEFNHVCPSN